MSRNDSAGWGTLLLRATIFVDHGLRFPDLRWWEEMVGAPPEEKTIKPQSAIEIHRGPFHRGRLILEVKPGRIDYVWRVVESSETEIEGLPSLGPFGEVRSQFSDPITRWLREGPKANRLAFGAKLFQPAEGLEDAMRRLAKLLPAVKIDPKDSSDFAYSINRRRKSDSGVSNLKINRLSKWGAGTYRTIQIDLLSDAKEAAKTIPVGADYAACQLELDINTMPEPNVSLPSNKLSGIMNELTQLGVEIATKGDLS